MDTIARVMELADERNLSLFKLSQLCDVSYSNLRCVWNFLLPAQLRYTHY